MMNTGGGWCHQHGHYQHTVTGQFGCPKCPVPNFPPPNAAAQPIPFGGWSWTGMTTGGEILPMTIFRERERYRDALRKILDLADEDLPAEELLSEVADAARAALTSLVGAVMST